MSNLKDSVKQLKKDIEEEYGCSVRLEVSLYKLEPSEVDTIAKELGADAWNSDTDKSRVAFYTENNDDYYDKLTIGVSSRAQNYSIVYEG